MVVENDIQETHTPSHEVLPGNKVPHKHPFVLVEEEARYLILEVTQNGDSIRVPRLVGRLALAVDVGVDNGKTREELCDRYLYFDKPGRTIGHSGFATLLGKTRAATKDHAFPIAVEQKYINDKSTYLYYYEDTTPQDKGEDYELWDVNSTCIRFDTTTNCLTVAREGVRTSARVVGPMSQKILEYLLRRPNETVYGHVLYNQIHGLGHVKGVRRIGTTVGDLRRWIKKHLRQDPHSLLEVEVSANGKGTLGLYTLRADRVEIIEKDGSMHLPCEVDTESVPIQPVDPQSLAILALGLSIQRSHVDRLRKVLPSGILPDDKFLTDLVADTLFGSGNARQLIADNIDRCLREVRSLFDSEGAQETIQNWSPDDARLKTFILSLEQFDKLGFNLHGKSVRGIDLLDHLLKPSGTR